MTLTNFRRIVHIGVGNSIPGVIGRPVNPQEVHICFELNKKDVVSLKRHIKSFGFAKQVKVVNRSGTDTRLKTASVDEVHMHNVISEEWVDQIIHQEERHAPGAYYAEDLIKEAKRIIKDNGSIYIATTYRPRALPKEELASFAARHGLKTEILAEDTHTGKMTEEQERLIKQHVEQLEGISPDKGWYLARLTKIG